MFVEGVRLFMVVLGTAAGYWVSRSFGAAGSGLEGLGGMVGCLAGYVGGGVLGRLLERAMGVVERKVERIPPAQVVAGALGAIGGGMVALLISVPIVLLVPGGLGIPIAGLLVWVSLWRSASASSVGAAPRCSRCSACRVARSCAPRRTTRTTVCSSTRR